MRLGVRGAGRNAPKSEPQRRKGVLSERCNQRPNSFHQGDGPANDTTPGPRYKQDLHYSFVEYGGSNITHWSFFTDDAPTVVERLCGKLLLIADKDGSGNSAKVERHQR